MVVVMHKLVKPFACARPTADPRVVETVEAHFEGVKSLLDKVSIGIVNPTVES